MGDRSRLPRSGLNSERSFCCFKAVGQQITNCFTCEMDLRQALGTNLRKRPVAGEPSLCSSRESHPTGALEQEDQTVTKNYFTVGELALILTKIDPSLPIKIVIVDSEDNPYCDAVLQRGTCSVAPSSTARIAEGLQRDALVVTCLGLYD